MYLIEQDQYTLIMIGEVIHQDMLQSAISQDMGLGQPVPVCMDPFIPAYGWQVEGMHIRDSIP